MNRRKLERRTLRAAKLRFRWMLARATEQLLLESAGHTSKHFTPIAGGYINRPAVRLLDAPILCPGGRSITENFTYESAST